MRVTFDLLSTKSSIESNPSFHDPTDSFMRFFLCVDPNKRANGMEKRLSESSESSAILWSLDGGLRNECMLKQTGKENNDRTTWSSSDIL